MIYGLHLSMMLLCQIFRARSLITSLSSQVWRVSELQISMTPELLMTSWVHLLSNRKKWTMSESGLRLLLDTNLAFLRDPQTVMLKSGTQYSPREGLALPSLGGP